MADAAGLRSLVEGARERIIEFGRRVIATPSLSGQEGDLAALVRAEMEALGYDRVDTDAAGNVFGRLSGGPAGVTMLHSHMDVVDPGDASRWRFPPFSGQVAEGYLWGRGASDTKGCLIAQVYAGGLLSEAGLTPSGDVVVAAVVAEETAGLGTRHMVQSFLPDILVIGEPSANVLRRGHRGRIEFMVTIAGRSAHASTPDLGVNPHYSLSRFLLALREAPMPQDDTFGGSNVTPTLIYGDQTYSNVIPSRVTVHLDWRTLPGQREEDARRVLEEVLRETVEPGASWEIRTRQRTLKVYTGLEDTFYLDMPGFVAAADAPHLLAARDILSRVLGREVAVDVWRFTTDGGHLARRGVPCLGFGPGDPALAHVLDERLSIEQLLEATVGYMALALELGRAVR